MSPYLIAACLWILTSVVVAMLPMRHQFIPGFALLLAALVLIGLIWAHHGALIALPALAGFLSMFRRPLMYYGRKALGKTE